MKQKQLWMIVSVVLSAIGFASAQHYTAIDAPGAGTGAGQGTFLQNVTDSDLTFGYYVDSNSVAHGFLRSREGNYTTFDVPGAGAGANNAVHGFLRTPW
jgi:hypothetical protein